MKTYLLIVVFLFFSKSLWAVNDSIVKPQVRNSPILIANLLMANNTYVKCTYGQPLKKGREVFGSLVPYGKLWRTGANEATEVTFTTDVIIGDTPLEAGTYTLFTIPNQENWTIILNSVLGQWGDFTYDASKNILVFEVPVIKNQEIYEGFTIQFDEKTAGFDMNLLWDSTKIQIPVQLADKKPTSMKKKKKRKP